MAQCAATSTRSGEQCRASAVHGATVCAAHGGRAPQVKAAAKRRLANAKALQFLHEQGVPQIDNPLQAFHDLVEESVALKQFFAAQMAQLSELTSTDDQAKEQAKAMVELYERALDRAAKFLTDWVRLDMDNRWLKANVRLTEERAKLMRRLLDDTFADPDLGLTQPQQETGRRVFARHLRLVTDAA